ncbi:MAG: TauD/TfdA family dioxygenase [Pseudomonadota bacterium]
MSFAVKPLPGGFGSEVLPDPKPGCSGDWVDDLLSAPAALTNAFYDNDGLLLFRGLDRIRAEPHRLVELSALFGTHVENYYQTLMRPIEVHADVHEIFIVSNGAPMNRQPPAPPSPARTDEGELPVQFPHRRGWHTDQSYRRPPPDVSLFYAVEPVAPGQGQTLYANGYSAYQSLPESLREKAAELIGLHAQPGLGFAEKFALSGEPPPDVPSHKAPQPQPVVRIHPVTRRPALYLCEAGQMDWYNGPFVDMEGGPNGAGASLLYELMSHYTHPNHVYVHEWERGDLIIYDNRSSVHCATWFDTASTRVMWRTTVRGNPGPEYHGESDSWIAPAT